jgi:hypothetical protein
MEQQKSSTNYDLTLRLSEEIIEELNRIDQKEARTLSEQVEVALGDWQRTKESGRHAVLSPAERERKRWELTDMPRRVRHDRD